LPLGAAPPALLAFRVFAGLAGIVGTAFMFAAIGFIPLALAVVMTLLGGPYFVAVFFAARRRKMRR
jgi:hypothetical protein